MVHTGSVTKVQGEGKQWLTKHGSLPEGFSICPVYAGMNLPLPQSLFLRLHLPRIRGDEPSRVLYLDLKTPFAPYTRG